MAEVTRRVFLGTGVGAAAAGVAIAAVPGLATAAGATTIAGPGAAVAPGPSGADVGDGEYVLHVRNASTGEVCVLNGEREVIFTDPQLVARVVAASNGR